MEFIKVYCEIAKGKKITEQTIFLPKTHILYAIRETMDVIGKDKKPTGESITDTTYFLKPSIIKELEESFEIGKDDMLTIHPIISEI